MDFIAFVKGFANPEYIPYLIAGVILGMIVTLFRGFSPHIVDYVVSKLARAGERRQATKNRRQATKERKRIIRLEALVLDSFAEGIPILHLDPDGELMGEWPKAVMTKYNHRVLDEPVTVELGIGEGMAVAIALRRKGYGDDPIEAIIDLYPQLEDAIQIYQDTSNR